ncbi:vacuolar ATPase assembly integral membrane protein vma21-like [Mytilus californianus]|uniref:vacuolar ATPase assembly integral membrane protein vma21-like n=1 Tax=Mytilus californianus TaxID=6549 RepID=UPI00224705E8|nr:vacuolar ATPase assembly integral membrane protein vma21-like [Mytilus californianus]
MADDLRTRMEDKEKTDTVMRTMVVFSLAMITLPIFLYFISKSFFFEAFLGMSSENSYFYAAFVAIGTVHIILGLFVYRAFTEDSEARRTPYKED